MSAIQWIPVIKRLLFLILVCAVGIWGFLLSLMVTFSQLFNPTIFLNVLAWLGYVYLGIAWVCHRRLSRNTVAFITAMLVLNIVFLFVPLLPMGQIQKISMADAIDAMMVMGGLFSIGTIFSFSNALMAMYLVVHHWTNQQKLARK